MTYTAKYSVEESFNLEKSRSNIINTFFYSNRSEVATNLKGMLYKVTYKTTI